jgi:hypothetical protein
MLISEQYRLLNTELHNKLEHWGGLSPMMIHLVKTCAQELDAHTILDYGCGKAYLQKELGSVVTNYDPAIKEFSNGPAPADLVVCASTLEHIEPEYLGNVLDHIQSLSLKGVLLTIATVTSRHVLSDGRNAHLIIEPMEWWLPKLIERWDIMGGEIEDLGFWFYGWKKKHGTDR